MSRWVQSRTKLFCWLMMNRQFYRCAKPILKENGFENIVTANTALSALERMSAKPDMAVLDVMLPDMDGFMLAKTIREQNPIPILFLTAKGEIER